jgi:uncharacterized protein YabN with tetrapyrrole methylase and pyrophosphatase domain
VEEKEADKTVKEDKKGKDVKSSKVKAKEDKKKPGVKVKEAEKTVDSKVESHETVDGEIAGKPQLTALELMELEEKKAEREVRMRMREESINRRQEENLKDCSGAVIFAAIKIAKMYNRHVENWRFGNRVGRVFFPLLFYLQKI